ncbi:PAP/fibrillin family protein [Myxosarcina sp. GI1]|uniref:PAP/fibrillin family protein n=1 Tax=Myxosarcina sp. GI1 TaxID=1541065 RepID=UPI00056BD28C|nr:PAP/fibrillin family protein [Myxosarcina sp. GI1]
MNPVKTSRDIAKSALLEKLAVHHGDTKNSEVLTAIEELASLNPTTAPTKAGELLEGNWLLINAPIFPNRLPDERGRYIYTLGRLAFNMFEPVDLKLEIERVLQPVFATGKDNERTHDIVVEFKVIDARFPELRGIVKNLAVCIPRDENTLQVQFVEGELIPRIENKNIEQWLAVFGNSEANSPLSIGERIKTWFIKQIFGIKKTSAINTQTGTRAFKMNKSPKGKLQILYLDEELRITKGNRETVLVCQRQ